MISCGSCIYTSVAELLPTDASNPSLITGEGLHGHDEGDQQVVGSSRESTLYAPLPSIVLIGLCFVVQDPAPAQGADML